VINDVLDLSKIEAGRMVLRESDFDLRELADGLSSMFRLRCEQMNLKWRTSLPAEDSLVVHGDEGKLRQVLVNLLGNAVKFTEKGQIGLTIQRISNDSFHFEVSDTGHGISEQEQAILFQPFSQGEEGQKKGGTGLGLAISRKQVELMGGQLNLESRLGQGTQFSFILPLKPSTQKFGQVPKGLKRQIVRLAPGIKVSALVVDDKKENREVLGGVLSMVGVDVAKAANGAEALQQIKLTKPDIIFSDIRMPDIDGLELVKQIVAAYGNARPKLIAVSASVLIQDQQQSLNAGFDAFIPKPIIADTIYDILKTRLGIEYEYLESAPPQIDSSDWQKIRLPKNLVHKMVLAAEIGDIGQLTSFLKDLERFGSPGLSLASQLKPLLDAFDMESAAGLLKRLPTATD
jgi:CheY-like chemotaxis protein